MGLIIGGVSASDLILDGRSVSLYVGGNPPTKVWPTRDTVQITLGTDLEARDQFRAALADRGLNYQTVEELPFDIELVGTGSARDMFRGCSALTSVPDMDTSGVTNMRSMFNGCSALTSVPDMDTSQVTHMGWMFNGCSALTSVPDLDTNNVTNMTSMFQNCSALTDGNVLLIGRHPQVNTTNMILNSGLNREPFDTVQIILSTVADNVDARDQLRDALSDWGLDYQTVTEIPFNIELVGSGSVKDMFRGCEALTSVPAMNTAQVTDMSNMFEGCAALTSVPAMDTSSVTNMFAMFFGCLSLTSAPTMDTSSVTHMVAMFYNCPSLTHVPDMDTSRVRDMSHMFSYCSSLTDGNVRLIGRHPQLTTTDMILHSGLTREPWYTEDGQPWPTREVVQITLDTGYGAQRGVRDALSARGLNYRNVTELPFDIELVGSGSTSNMFDNCRGLTSVPRMNTITVTNMERMFNGCSALTSVPRMNTSNVTNMSNMFYNCRALTSVPAMDTSQVTSATQMFRNCSSLTDDNVRLIGKNPNVDAMNMIQSSGLTREPFYATDRLPHPPDPRVVTIRRGSTYGQWDKNSATGDVSLIQEWVGNDGVRFVAYVTCDNSVSSGDSYQTQNPGAVHRSGAIISPWMSTVYTFTEVI